MGMKHLFPHTSTQQMAFDIGRVTNRQREMSSYV